MNYTYHEVSQRLDRDKTHKQSYQIFIPFCPAADSGGFLFSSVSETQWSVDGVEVKRGDVSSITAPLQLHFKASKHKKKVLEQPRLQYGHY